MPPDASGEFAFIHQIQKEFSSTHPDIPLGIGDDAAAVIPSPKKYSLLTTDTLVEGSHFRLSYSSFEQIGYKAVQVNLSDIAAMGGEAQFFLVSLGLPKEMSSKDLNQLYKGIKKASRIAKIECVGGNITMTRGPFFISLTLMGAVSKHKMIRRNGALASDGIYVTGTLGDSSAGLDYLKNEKKLKGFQRLLKKHQRPEARCDEGKLLAEVGIPSAMIDLSDGLTGDLGHIMKQSGVGAELDAAQIPISIALKRYAKKQGKSPLEFALSGGEDYELLFTVPKKKEKQLRQMIDGGLIQATRIGEVNTKRNRLILKSPQQKNRLIRPSAYDHFNIEPVSLD